MHYLRWFIFNGVFITSIYLGLVKEINGALNVAIFIGWVLAVVGSLAVSATVRKGVVKQFLEKDKVLVNKYLDVGGDALIVFAFLWFGYLWLAGFLVLALFSGLEIRREYSEWKNKSLIEQLKAGYVER